MYLNNIKRFLTVILSLIIFTSFFGTTYLISIPHGIISTLLMPIISGDNMSKVGFYEQLHSNFGAIYHIFNLIGLKFINSTPKLQLFDLIPLTSFFWAILCCFFYLLCNYSLEKKYKISNIILLFAISSIFQLRDLSQLYNLSDVSWQNIVQNNIFGIITIYLAYILKVHGFYKYSQRLNPIFAIFSAVVCLYITFNFYIYFIPTLALLTLALNIYINPKFKVTFSLATISLFTSMCIATSAVSGYSYKQYFFDVLSLTATPNLEIYLEGFCSAICYVVLSFLQNNYTKLPFDITECQIGLIPLNLKRHKTRILQIIKFNIKSIKADFVFDLILSSMILSLVFTETLSGFTSILYIVIIRMMCSNISQNFPKIFASILLLLVITFNTLSLAKFSFYKFFNENPSSQENIVKLIVKDKNANFVLAKYSGLSYFQDLFDLRHNLNKEKVYTELSYAYEPEKVRWRIPYHNTDFIHALNNTQIKLNKIGIEKSDKILMLGNINPLPLLMNTSIPKNSTLMFNTKSNHDRQVKLDNYDNYSSNDFIVMPIFGFDDLKLYPEQAKFNCNFYTWNGNAKIFKPVDISAYGIIFANERKIRKLGLDVININMKPQAMKVCNKNTTKKR